MNAEKTGSFIRSMRKEKNYTQQVLAEKLNVSDKAISRWETGKGFPDIGNLEDLAGALGVSVAEILKGERFKEEVSVSDVNEVTVGGIEIAKEYVAKKKWMNILVGFLCGAIIVLLLFIHLLGPIPIKNSNNALSVETLSNGELVAVLNKNVAGYEMSKIGDENPESGCISLSCYETLWNRLFGEKNKSFISLGNVKDVRGIYYYPSNAKDGSDELVWENEKLGKINGGVVTLERRGYLLWVFAGIFFSIVGIVLSIVLKKKHYFKVLLRMTMVVISLTISVIVTLIGNAEALNYNAYHYLSGVILLAILIYSLFEIVCRNYKKGNNKVKN